MLWRELWAECRQPPGVVCPECGGQVQYVVVLWELNGKPVEVDFDCAADPWHDFDPDDDDDDDAEETHHYRQSDWQPIRDQLEVLAKAEWKRIRAAIAAESEAT